MIEASSRDGGAAAGGHSLRRALRPRHVTMITIGGVIGAGLFVGSSAAIAAAGPAAVLSYALAGALVLVVMRMLGEMAVAHPEVRTFTEFARLGLGDWAGHITGWLYWFFWVVVIPIEVIAGAAIVHAWWPLPQWQIGLALLAAMVAVNLASVRAFGEFEFWFASIKVAAIIAFIVIAGAYATGLTNPGGPTFGNLVAHGGWMPHGAVAVLATVVTVIFAMTGAAIVTIAAAESPEPARAVARMTSSVGLRILVFYVGAVFAICCVLPWTSVRPGESPFTAALQAMRVPLAGTVMSFVILTAVLSCLNSAFYVSSRMLFVLAARGDAPAWLVRMNARGVPTPAVLLSAVFGLAGVVAAIASPGVVFAFLLNASGATMLMIYLAVAAAQVRLRRARAAAGAPRPAIETWGYPWLSYGAMGAMLAVLAGMAATPALRSQLYASLVPVAVSACAWGLLARRRRVSRSTRQESNETR